MPTVTVFDDCICCGSEGSDSEETPPCPCCDDLMPNILHATLIAPGITSRTVTLQGVAGAGPAINVCGCGPIVACAWDTSTYMACYGNGIPATCHTTGASVCGADIFPAWAGDETGNCVCYLQMLCDGTNYVMNAGFGGYSSISSDCLELTGCLLGGPPPSQTGGATSQPVPVGLWPCKVGELHMPFFFEFWLPGIPLHFPFQVVVTG